MGIIISVVIPAYNEENMVGACLESFKHQDFSGDYEVIVAENGSTDNTARIAQNYGVKMVSCPEVKSVFYARQIGADAASGDIIIQADADTVYPKEWLRRIAAHFTRHPEAVAVAGRYIYHDPTRWADIEYFLRFHLNRFTRWLLGRPMIISGAAFAFRRKAFESANGYHGLTYSPDQYGIAGRLSHLGKIIFGEDLVVATSSRRVKKPLPVLTYEAARNVWNWAVYFLTYHLNLFWKYLVASPSRRVITIMVPACLPLIVVASGYFIPSSPVFGKVYAQASTSEREVALTFDDGPNDPYTSQVLDILGKYNIKATFFLVGYNVELYPDTAKRIIAEGGVVGNHSYSHKANHALSQFGARDLSHAQVVFNNILGVKPHLYRPPNGRKTPWELQSLKKKGMIEVVWSAEVNDQGFLDGLDKPSPSEEVQELISEIKPGRIILLHDGHGTEHNTEKSDKSITVEILPLLIEELQSEGYKFVTVPELLDVPGYTD